MNMHTEILPRATDFTVSVAPILDREGREIDPDIARGVYRDDTGELLSTCGKTYEPIQHRDVLNPVLEALDDQGYEIMERSADQRSLYDLKGRKGAFVKTALDGNGAVMRTDIIVGDFIQPSGSSYYLPKGDDTMFRRFTILNSHTGWLAAQALQSYMRLVCLNGMVDAKWTAGIRARHTTGVDVEALRERIAAGVHMGEEDAERFGLYARTKVSPDQARTFFKRTIAKMTGETEEGEPKFSARLVDDLVKRFEREDQTVWGLWNAMTAWATHAPTRAGSTEIGTSLSREGRVAAAMRSKRFEALIAA